MGGFNWDDVVSSGARSRQAAEEAFYGFGDFFRDLDRDRYSAAPPSSTVCNASGQHCTCCPSTIHYLACHGEGALEKLSLSAAASEASGVSSDRHAR